MNRPPILVWLLVGMALAASTGCGKNGASSDAGGTGGAIGVAGLDGGTGGDLGSGGAPAQLHGFTHPGIPLSLGDLVQLKSNLGNEPWKSGYALLTADSHSQLGYAMQGPFAMVSRTPNVNLGQYGNDMQAVLNLARMWFFTGNVAYAQKAHDIMLAL